MHILSSILLAFSASLDSFIIGLAYGIKKIKISLMINVIIAFIVSAATFLSMYLGRFISEYIPDSLSNTLGSVVLIVLGIYMIIDYIKKENPLLKKTSEIKDSLDYEEIINKNITADINNSGSIEVREAITLALALSINNVGLGIGASITGINIYFTTICTFIFSIVTMMIGFAIGKSCIADFLGKYASLIGALIIIIMGIREIFF